MTINIVVFMTPEENFFQELSGLFSGLRASTLPEIGCLQFDVYKHEKDYVLIEEWEDQAAIDLHMEMDYTKVFREKIAGKIVKTSVNRLEEL